MRKFTFSIIAALSLCLLPVLASGQTTNALRLLDKDGKGIGSTSGNLNVECANCSGGGTGLTDVQLRAAPIGVTGAFYQATQPVSGTFWQATQPVSGPLTDVQLRASPLSVTGTFFQVTQPVSIASMPSTPVTGTFWPATQPVSGTFWQTTQPVSGTFWQGTQPVSIATMPTTPVTGTFFQATQPVSATSLPLPSNAAQETGGNLATLAGKDFSTSAKQDTGNTSLGTIAGKDFSTSAKQDAGNSSLASIDAKIPTKVINTIPVTVMLSAVPLPPVIPASANRLQYATMMQRYCQQTLCPPLPGGFR